MGAMQGCPDGKMVYVAGSWIVVSHKDDPTSQTYLRGHNQPIMSLAVSPSGRFAASGESGKDSDVIVWDLHSLSLLYRLSEHDHGVHHVSFSHDEKLLLSVSGVQDDGGKLIVWDVSSGMIVAQTRKSKHYVSTPAQRVHHTLQRIHNTALLMPDSTTRAAVWTSRINQDGSYGFITAGHNFESQARGPQFWTLNPYNGELDHVKGETRKVKRSYTCLCWSPREDLLLAGTETGDVAVFYNTRLQEIIPTCRGAVMNIVGPMANGVFVAGGYDGSIVPFSPNVSLPYASGDLLTPGVPDVRRMPSAAEIMGGVSSMTYIQDTDEVLIGSTCCLTYKMNMGDFSLGVLRENHMGPVTQVCFNPNADDLFATSSEDKSVILWSLNDYTVHFKSTHSDAGICWCVAMSDQYVLSGWQDGDVRAFTIPTGELAWSIHNVHAGGVRQICVSYGQNFFATGGEKGDVRFWDMGTKSLISMCVEHKSPVTGLEMFDGDEACLSSSKDGSFAVWDVRRGSRLSAHRTSMGAVNGVALARDQLQVVTTGRDKQLTFWDLRETHPVQRVQEAHVGEGTCVCISQDGAIVASGGADQVCKFVIVT